MAKTWYPVIDYSACTACGTCVSMCSHGVYDAARAPSPLVLHPEGCIDHCHGCGSRCPAGAITYVGDDTGWTPPNGAPETTEDYCARGCEEPSGKKVTVDYLYLDLQTCERCIGTDRVLDEVMAVLTPALRLAGFTVETRQTEMATAEIAAEHRFLSSPTIRVNGRDICGPVAENSCGCCGDISGTAVDCRVFAYQGQAYDIPPAEMLAEAILRAVFVPAENGCDCGGYTLPENLKSFFKGKEKKTGCTCGCC